MDSSDDEFLNDVTNQLEDSLLNPEQTDPTSQTDIKVGDSADMPDSKALKILFQKFGHKTFRPLQWKIINSLLKYKQDNCVVMTTGYGKSLCYQFPAVFSGGVTLVISPLISLMEDQVLALTIANIPSCLLGTAQTNKSQTIKNIFNNKYSVIYITPELCTEEYGIDLMKRMQSLLQITLIAVDEAHCVSSWGHDFRPSYRQLGILKDIFPTVPILAVTATATELVKRDIVAVLKLKNPQIVTSGFDRPNLYFEVNPKTENIINDFKQLMLLKDGHWFFDGPTIIYCPTRKETEEIGNYLKLNGIDSLTYHAGMSLPARKESHEKFVKDIISVVVATIAFGMGIDKPDIRNVIHYGMSKSIESYYQEVGRAGRDGLPAKCVTFFKPHDSRVQMFLISQGENQKQKLEMLSSMNDYLRTTECRRKFILSYFGDRSHLGLCKRKTCCDNCSGKNDVNTSMYEGLDDNGMYDFTEDAVKYLSAVEALGGCFGNSMYNLFVRGSKNSKIRENHRNHPCFGSGRNKPVTWWKAIADFLEDKKYLAKIMKKRTGDNPYSYYIFEVSEHIGRTFLNQPASKRKLIDKPTANILNLLKKKQQLPSRVVAEGWVSNNKSSTMIISSSQSHSVTIKKEDKDNQEDVDARLKLFRFLKNCRSQLAAQNECMPYMVSSDFVLMEIAKYRPRDLEHLRQLRIEGLNEAKISKFGEQLLKVVTHNTPASFYTKELKIKKQSIQEILEENPIADVSMNTSATTTYELFKTSMPLEEIARERELAVGTVSNHLSCAIECGYPITLGSLGVTPRIRAIIIQVMNNLGQYSMLLRIKNACPENVTYAHIKAVMAYIKVRDHLNQLGIPYEEFEDFQYQEKVAPPQDPKSSCDDGLSDGNDDLLSDLLDEMQNQVDQDETQKLLDDIQASTSSLENSDPPPCKKIKTAVGVLDSPPRENPACADNVTVGEKKLPQWLTKKKV